LETNVVNGAQLFLECDDKVVIEDQRELMKEEGTEKQNVTL
jgi:hypothetical protein